MTTRLYYAFRYADTRQTTTGGDHGTPLHIAGQLLSFPSRARRDEWVSCGYSCPVPRDWGEYRAAVTTRDLPMGWRVSDAIDHGEYVRDWCDVPMYRSDDGLWTI